MPKDLVRIEEIFTVALAEHDAAARARYLDATCDGDADLRGRVEALLAAHDTPENFLKQPAAEAPVDSPAYREAPGTTIGRYRLLEQIGEGGFGVVFLAQQDAPVRRRVALKILKPGMDTREVIGRFEAERQALAMMDHPHIAKVFDAGATDAGRPYFVMELVQGVPITEYCDECNLATRERLELFVTVCQAVQHAHQQGVIHRDIKPTNVLVAIEDGRPAPKIIDFGVAKAINQRLTEHTLTTAFAQMVGSPLYMSPEQAELSPLGVDTRSDIYSLGVLLYELLTGATPFDKERLHAALFDEFRRIIREEEPPRPSARISTLAADLATTIAEHRRTDVRRLRQTVRGELDWIVMKCLEKDRNRRYETASSLTRDIERYLHDEPVQACPPSIPYRFKKFVRKHKAATAFIGLLLISVAGLAVSNIALKRERDAKTTALAQATTESARARAISDLLQEMLGSANAERTKGGQYTLRELLDDFSSGLGDQLANQPEVEADIHATIGRAYHSLRLFPQAAPHVQRALELRRQIYGPQHEKVAESLVDYAWSPQSSDEAVTRLQEALDIYHQLGTTGRPVIVALWQLQLTLSNQKRYEEAAVVAQQGLDLVNESPESYYPEKAKLLRGLGRIRMEQARYSEAEQALQQAVELHRRVYGPLHLDTAFDLQRLGNAFRLHSKFAEAEPVLRDALSVFRQHFAANDSQVLSCLHDLQRVLEARGDQAALDALASKQTDDEFRSVSPEYQLRLAGLLLASQSPSDASKEEARRLIQRVVQASDQMAVDNPGSLTRRLKAARGYVDVARTCAADPDLADVMNDAYDRLMAELQDLLADFPESRECQSEVAERYRLWGTAVVGSSAYLSQAEHAFGEAIKLYGKLMQDDPQLPRGWYFQATSFGYLGDVQWQLGRPQEAAAAVLRAREIYEGHPEEDERKVPYVIDQNARGAYYLTATGREQQAAEFIRTAALVANRLAGADDSANALDDPNVAADTLYYLAVAQARLGDKAGYRATCKALVELPFGELESVTKSRPIWTPCLGPDALDDPTLPVKLAEELVADKSMSEPQFGLYMLGAAHYRAGHYDRAAQRLEESIATFATGSQPVTHSICYPRLFLAMTHWQQGKRDEARRLLAETQPAVDEELQSSSSSWNRKATLEVLLSEAEALIEPHEPDEATQNESRASSETNQDNPTATTPDN